MEDSFRTQGLRRKLVATVAEKGITDERVLNAMQKVPRHFFFDSSFLSHAYEDKAFPIGSGQTISQPFTVAFQTQLLQVEKGKKLLEIGTGSGYQAAIISELGGKLFTIERHRPLYEKAKTHLPKWGYKAKFFYGDGYKGLPAFAPFDGIIVTCGAPFIPEDLKKQLKIGGRLVIPVGGEETQKMILVVRKDESTFTQEEFGDFAFVPMLENKA